MCQTFLGKSIVRHKTLFRILPIFIIVVVWMLFFWRVLTPVSADRLTFQQGDFTLQFLAYRDIAYQQILGGHMPVFTECIYSGYPFQADPQSQVLYPPLLLMMQLGTSLGWLTYPLRALEWEVMLHVLIATLCMYSFLRKLCLHRLASLLGAIVYGFNGFLTGYAMLQTAILETTAWFPLILLALRGLASSAERFVDVRNVVKHRWPQWILPAALLATSVTLAFTAGHPQSLLFIIYAGAFAYAIWGWQAKLRFSSIAFRGIVASVLAIGLSAAQLIPSLSFMMASTRTTLSFTEASNGFALHDIALSVLGGVIAVWQPLYVSIVALFLVGVALATRRIEVWMWFGIAVSALILGFGANALGFDLAYIAAPGYRQFHSQERHALVVVTALSVLSAYGLHTLIGPFRASWRRRFGRLGIVILKWALGAFTALLIVIVYQMLAEGTPSSSYLIADRIAMIAICLFGTGCLLLYRTKGKNLTKWAWALAVVAVVVFDLVTTNRYTAMQPPADPFPEISLISEIPENSSLPASIKKVGAYRINNHYGLPLNTACIHNLAEIGGGSPIMLKSYRDFLDKVPEDVYSQLLSVWYTVTWRGGMGTENGRHIPERLVATGKYQNIEANTFFLNWPAPGVQPAWIATKVTVVSNLDTLFKRMAEESFVPLGEAFISDAKLPIPNTGAHGTAGMDGKSNGYMKVTASADGPALLVVSEAYHWNWIALVNGLEVKPILADGALLAVPIPAGSSTIEFSYRPIDLYIGLVISALTIIVMAVLMYMHSRTIRTPNGDTK